MSRLTKHRDYLTRARAGANDFNFGWTKRSQALVSASGETRMPLDADVLRARAGEWFNAGLAFLYPEWCQVCNKARASRRNGYVCPACAEAVKYTEQPWCELCGRPFQGAIDQSFVCGHCKEVKPSWVFARSSTLARGTVLEAVHRYKYNGAVCLEPFLADLLVQRAAPVLRSGHWDAVVPVPLHPVKERERGFNQAESLGRHLAKALNLLLRKNLVRRVAATRTQTLLTREERRANVQGAFAPVRPESANGLRLIVVDDVFTTGATTDACAKALLKAGAEAVCVWTVARGI